MKRIQHDLVQGTPEWHAFRAEHDGASEAPAMLGLSKYVTRAELLRQKATGIAPDVDAGTQRLFDAGHATEAAARPLAEEIIGDEFYPATYSYGRLSASCDGLTMDGSTAFEHKLYRADLAAAVMSGELPDEYMAQCQQIMLVTGAERVLFVTSDGTDANWAHMFVEPDAVWQHRIIAGWKQFNDDRANYQHIEVIPAAVAAPVMQLPALSVQVKGEIQVIDNLAVFGERLSQFIEGIDKAPSDDQGFADAEAAIKTLGAAETALEAAKSSALAQTASIEEMVRTVALYAGQARTTRLTLERMVKARKETIRVEIVQKGKDTLREHINTLNKRLGETYMVVPPVDFGAAIKGKRTIASLHDAVDTLLANAKIEANAIADRIQINLTTLRELGKDHAFLFNDAAQIVHKAPDDLTALVHMRLNEHRVAEAKRIEAEREKIRAEEVAKLQREQEREALAARLRQEAEARIAAEAQRATAAAQAGANSGAAIVSPAPAATQQKPKGDLPISRGNQGATGPSLGATGGAVSPGPKPTVRLNSAGRPSDDDIIKTLALHYRVHESMVIGWLLDMDLESASERMVEEFTS